MNCKPRFTPTEGALAIRARTTVVPITQLIGTTVVRIASPVGQRPVIVMLHVIGSKCGQSAAVTLPTLSESESESE